MTVLIHKKNKKILYKSNLIFSLRITDPSSKTYHA
jgi:hypothetical protein